MTFAAPLFLWMLPLVAAPVVFHLMMRRKRKRHEFPSLMFFIKADPQIHSRRRLRELLLLASRMLLILLLLLALSRPSLQRISGIGGELAVAIVLDNSASMSQVSGDHQHTKLQLAQTAARDLVNALGERSQACVLLTVDDPGVNLGHGLTVEHNVLLDTIDRVRPTEAAGDVVSVFSRLQTILESAPDASGRAIHIFSDLQETEWGGEAVDTQSLSNDAAIVLHRIESPEDDRPNVAIESPVLPKQRMLPRHSYPISVSVRNDSTSPAQVRVNHEDSQGQTSSQALTVAVSASEVVQLAFQPNEPGRHWMMIWVEGDRFRGDNRAGVGLICDPKSEVRFAGSEEPYGLLPTAISPSGTGRFTSLIPAYRESDRLMDTDQQQPAPIAVVCTWHVLGRLPTQQLEKLKTYVEDGGRLLVLPAVQGTSLQDVTWPAWLGASAGPYQQPTNPIAVEVLDRRAELWGSMRGSEGRIDLRYLSTLRYHELELDGPYQALVGFSYRRPVMAQRSLGLGRVFVSGIAFDKTWTGLVSDPSGIALLMVHNMATQGGRGVQNISIVAGQRLPAMGGRGQTVKVDSLVGDVLSSTALASQLPTLALAGAYSLAVGGRQFDISVRGSETEASGQFITADVVPAIGEATHQVVALSGDRDFAAQLRDHHARMSLFVPLALLAAAMWAVEAWLSSAYPVRDVDNVAHSVQTRAQEPLGSDAA